MPGLNLGGEKKRGVLWKDQSYKNLFKMEDPDDMWNQKQVSSGFQMSTVGLTPWKKRE